MAMRSVRRQRQVTGLTLSSQVDRCVLNELYRILPTLDPYFIVYYLRSEKELYMDRNLPRRRAAPAPGGLCVEGV